MIQRNPLSRDPQLLPAVLTVFLGLALAACGGAGDGGSAVGDDDAPAAGSVAGTVSGDLVVIDRDAMPDLPCHAMDNAIMGDCSDDEVDDLLVKMGLDKTQIVLHDQQIMSDEECHTMETTIMGDCTEDDVARLAEEIRAQR